MKKFFSMKNIKTILLVICSAVIIKQNMLLHKSFDQTDQVWTAFVMCVESLNIERALR